MDDQDFMVLKPDYRDSLPENKEKGTVEGVQKKE
jgi:hypothetical protein